MKTRRRLLQAAAWWPWLGLPGVARAHRSHVVLTRLAANRQAATWEWTHELHYHDAVVALGGHVWQRENLGSRGWTAVGLAVGGVVLLSLARGDAGGAGSLAGNLLVLGCVVCEAIYALLGRRLTAQLPPMRISAWINAIGLALMTPPGLWQALHFDFGAVGLGHWLLLAFYSVSASIVSVWLWLSGLQRVPAGHAGVFTIAMPLAATAVGVAALGESVGWAHAVALAMAVAGILLIAREGAGAGRPRDQLEDCRRPDDPRRLQGRRHPRDA